MNLLSLCVDSELLVRIIGGMVYRFRIEEELIRTRSEEVSWDGRF